MSFRNRSVCITLGIVLGLSVHAFAQEKNVPQRKKTLATKSKPSRTRRARPGLSPAKVLVLRFDRSAPQIGDLLPDVAGYDAQGKPFALRSLKGHYTVLTFGCLT